jgi:hypothetical protein
MIITKEKINKIIFPCKNGLENKWWHRLANVLICISTLIVLAVSSALLLFDYQNQHVYTAISYDFEDNYNEAKGKEVVCENVPMYSSGETVWHCGNYIVDISDIVLRQKEAHPLQKLKAIGDVEIKFTRTKLEVKVINDTAIVMLKNIGYIILITIGWFIFWQSIVYRIFIYIVFGNKKASK